MVLRWEWHGYSCHKTKIGICQIRSTYSDSVDWVMRMPSLLRQVVHSFAVRSLSPLSGKDVDGY